MTRKCDVPHCKGIGAHKFPRDLAIKKLWLKAIRRPNFKPQENSRLCRNHFQESDYVKNSFYTGTENQHKYLHKSAVPTIFAWNRKPLSCEAQAREERLISRNIKKTLFEASTSDRSAETFASELQLTVSNDLSDLDFASEQCIEIENATDISRQSSPAKSCIKKFNSCGTQTNASLRIFSTELLLSDDESVHFYTGLETVDKFHLVMSTLLPMAYNIKYRWSQVIGLSVEDQFVIMLIKLRRNKPDLEIAKMFNISKTEVSNIIVTWIHFVSDLWSLIDIWPERDLVNFYMPNIFKEHNSTTRIILDATEIPIAKPSNPTSQKATYSSYKNTNTIKFLVGATPGGLISYCSGGYGGATSDRQILERSSLLDLCEEGDSIMADRGFNVQDIFAVKNISVNIPTFLKGKNQLPGFLLKQDHKLASQRVHIERLIGLSKTYKILTNTLNSYYVKLASKIFFICVMLCNFRESIVNKKK